VQLSQDGVHPFPSPGLAHYHDLIIALCVEAGFSPRIRHEVRLWQTVVTMVGRAMGIALVSQAFAQLAGLGRGLQADEKTIGLCQTYSR